MFSATLFVKHPTPAEPGTRLAAWPRPASTATTRASCRRCWPMPCPAQRCSRRECGGEWKAGHSACGWIYIYIYIYNYFILDLNSDWFTLSHTGSYWVPSSMSLTHDVSLYFLWISLCSSLIWEHDPTWPISAGRCVCVWCDGICCWM